MSLLKPVGVFSIIPTTLILTVSFFVLMAVRKAETQRLKVFGYVIAALLWACAALVLAMGIYTLVQGGCPFMKYMNKCSMRGQMHHMMNERMQPPSMQR